MSNLKHIDRIKLERLLNMGSGYVLHFNNGTLRDFVIEMTGIDIYDEQYSIKGESKANRLRAFWEIEADETVSKLVFALLELWKDRKEMYDQEIEESEQALFNDCFSIAENLNQKGVTEFVNGILKPQIEDKDFSVLAKNIKESIERNEPEAALDRLHTYTVKYFRSLCRKHHISYNKEKALHSLYGEYVKVLEKNKLIESGMTLRILKSSISLLDAFNSVRNDKSFAHDNPILNYQESMLIFKNISSMIEFIESVEGKLSHVHSAKQTSEINHHHF
ncbi:abortive infection family protein [Metabacillus idriensis]|uniref:abortive infection family protein n=1 Tax=Metabacillus idriensis TaxID=324768 RepID=UPI00204195A9|nr:abortive infection family protein [Metabacillus idriensis]MCM3597197.1 abortive infection family protein [Metabacillus idriensis]